MLRLMVLRLTLTALALLFLLGCAAPDAGNTASTRAAVPGSNLAAPIINSPVASAAPDIVFPAVSSPKSRGDMMVFANKLLYERSGKLCIAQRFIDPGGSPDWESMLTRLKDRTGILEDGVSFVGDLPGAFEAFGLERSGIELDALAFGLAKVPANRALPQLPQGTWWMPKLESHTVDDGRTVWYMNGEYFAAKDC